MTIKVEKDVILRVASPTSLIESSIQVDNEFILVDFRKPLGHPNCYCSSHEKNSQTETFDDDDSVFTLSTASLSDSDISESDVGRRVSFADDLVTDEWTRPYTPKDLIPALFYTQEETSRFRQEYRLERKLLLHDRKHSLLNLFHHDDSISSSSTFSSSSLPCSPPASLSCTARHRISRVVVLHKDKLETLFQDDGEADPDQVDHELSYSEPSMMNCSTLTDLQGVPPPESVDYFFDKDSFWSGSITWY